MSITPIYQLVDSLPADGLTIRLLQALDFVIPGQWQNTVGFDKTMRAVTGESDPTLLYQVRERAVALYNDPKQGYQRAMWLFQTVDRTDKALGAAAVANTAGGKIGLLSFLSKITPKAETTQTIDLAVKLVVELATFTQINGLPGDSIGDFVKSLGAYEKESLMRMAALIAVDGMLPLGPNFIDKIGSSLGSLGPKNLESNETYQSVKSFIPGGSSGDQLGFIGKNFNAVRGWIEGFVHDHDLTIDKLANSLRSFADITDDKLDYVAGFLDMTTNYFEHTGTQSLARSLISRAVSEI